MFNASLSGRGDAPTTKRSRLFSAPLETFVGLDVCGENDMRVCIDDGRVSLVIGTDTIDEVDHDRLYIMTDEHAAKMAVEILAVLAGKAPCDGCANLHGEFDGEPPCETCIYSMEPKNNYRKMPPNA